MTFPTFVVLPPTTARSPAWGGRPSPADEREGEGDDGASGRRTAVSVFAADRISADWASAWLRAHPDTVLLPPEKARHAGVLLYLTARSDDDPMELIRRSAGAAGIDEIPKVLAAPFVRTDTLLEAVGHGVVSVLNSTSTGLAEITEALVEVDRGGSRLPGALTRALTDEIRERRRDSDVIARRSGLEPRETEVLRMLAEGDGVRQIAVRLRYSESTVKGVIRGVVRRLGLRNRIEAVAYGLRIGAY